MSPERDTCHRENTAPAMLTRFPAGTHHKARRSHGAPPRWPVSGLAKTTRVPFPGGTDCADCTKWVIDTSGEHEGSRSLTVAGAAQVRARDGLHHHPS